MLALTAFLRQARVVGAYLEFRGEGVPALTVGDRATIANMAPEYGATAALFFIDAQTVEYLRLTGRDKAQVALVDTYAKQAGLWADTLDGAQYARLLHFDLSSVARTMALARPAHITNCPRSALGGARHCWRLGASAGGGSRRASARWRSHHCGNHLMHQYL